MSTLSSFQAPSIFSKIDEVNLEDKMNPLNYNYRLVVDVSQYKTQKNRRVMKATGGTLIEGTCIGKDYNSRREALRWSQQSGIFYNGANMRVEVNSGKGNWLGRSLPDMVEQCIKYMVQRDINNKLISAEEVPGDVRVLRYVKDNNGELVIPKKLGDTIMDVSYYANTRLTAINGVAAKLGVNTVVPNQEFAEGFLSHFEVYFNDLEDNVTVLPYENEGVHTVRMDLLGAVINVVYQPKQGFGDTLAKAAEQAEKISDSKLRQLSSSRSTTDWSMVTGTAANFALKPKTSAWTKTKTAKPNEVSVSTQPTEDEDEAYGLEALG